MLFRKPKPLLEMALWGLLGFCSFVLFIGKAQLLDWDEINFAESAREMMVSGNFFQVQINFEPFWEKPPLYFWLQVLSMKVFGINEFAARFPSVLAGVATLMALFGYAWKLRGQLFGRWVAALYFATLLPHFYFKIGVIDPVFNLFIFLGVIQFIRFEIGQGRGAPWWAGFWIGLAVLTKGPVALLVAGLTIGFYYSLFRKFRFPWVAALQFLAVVFFVTLSWFGAIILFTPDGLVLIQKFLIYQTELASQNVAGHAQPFYYHIVVFSLGCLPMSAFVFRGMGLRVEGNPDAPLKRIMLIWFWVVLILFSLVKTKIVHYSSLLYFPGAFLAALWLEKLVEQNRKITWDSWLLILFPTLIFGGFGASILWIVRNVDRLAPWVQDPFALAALNNPVHWSGWEFLPGLIFLLGGLLSFFFLLLRKKYSLFMAVQMGLTTFYVNGMSLGVLPKVLNYSQGAPVEFFKLHSSENPFFICINYKSYAPYFYGKVQPFPFPEIPVDQRERFVLYGDIDRPVYLVTKTHKINEDFKKWYQHFVLMYEKGGFAFFVRKPKTGLSGKGAALAFATPQKSKFPPF